MGLFLSAASVPEVPITLQISRGQRSPVGMLMARSTSTRHPPSLIKTRLMAPLPWLVNILVNPTARVAWDLI